MRNKRINIQRDLVSRENIQNNNIPEFLPTDENLTISEVVKNDKSKADKEPEVDSQPESKEQKKDSRKTKRNV